MRPEEYRSIIKRLETHYQEFLRTSQGSDLFGEEDKKTIQGHFDKAQEHYDTLIIQLTNNRKHAFCLSCFDKLRNLVGGTFLFLK